MITIHHLDNSRSERIVWLAEELNIPYEVVTHLRNQGMAPDSYRKIHSLGRAPVICDGPLTIMESGAICEYLVDKYGQGQLKPVPGSEDYVRYLEWMHFAEGSAMPGALQEFMAKLSGQETPLTARQRSRNNAMWRYVDEVLADRSYFAGASFSAADIMMEFNFAFMQRVVDFDLAGLPNITRWLDLVRRRPAYLTAMAITAPKVPLGFTPQTSK